MAERIIVSSRPESSSTGRHFSPVAPTQLPHSRARGEENSRKHGDTPLLAVDGDSSSMRRWCALPTPYLPVSPRASKL